MNNSTINCPRHQATALASKCAAIAALGVTLLGLQSCAAPGTAPAPGVRNEVRYVAPDVRERAAPAQARPELTADDTGPLALTVEDAVLVALEHNQALVVEKLNPPIARTLVEQQRAAFDPILRADVGIGRDRINPDRTGAVAAGRTSTVVGGISLGQYFPTGTSVSIDVTSDAFWRRPLGDYHASRIGLTATQALLRDFGVDVNLVNVRQARLDVLRTEFELRGFAEQLVAEVERAYWRTVLSAKQIQIYEESLQLAEQQLTEARERVEVGRLAETELAAGQAELARRREGLINARSSYAANRLRLLRLLNPKSAGGWLRPVETESRPEVPQEDELTPVEEHVKTAVWMRPELNQARLGVERNELELVRTRNGLLPQLDLFITLGRTGYADSFGESWRDLASGDSYDILGGVALEYPLYNRAARAEHQRALLNRSQAAEAVKNLAQLVELDVREAHIEVQRAREQVAATAATRHFQQESLRAESEKFRVGVSTSLLVAQAQRDLLSSQIAEVEAAVNYMLALVDLYRLDGSLLVRRGVVIGPDLRLSK